ncbi:type IV pilus modification protein PilV [Marinobacter salexigens]|uniref:type IV pilus modification protein PilV n=1 Tax=Marinobacter salexigens TaxID=1925763 RepID=UPI0019606AE5|nr:type IV pilus modification protein PilV [Marinobacter salexigens]
MSISGGVNKRQGGFSLIEVLIAVLILAIGLLGVAGVQYLSLKRTSDANLHSLATLQAQSIADTIRVTGAFNQSAVDGVISAELGPSAAVSASQDGDEWTVTLSWENQEGDENSAEARFRRR